MQLKNNYERDIFRLMVLDLSLRGSIRTSFLYCDGSYSPIVEPKLFSDGLVCMEEQK